MLGAMRWTLGLTAVLGLLLAPSADAQEVRVASADPAVVRAWDARVSALLRAEMLSVLRTKDDPLVPGRRHERLVQLHGGVPVIGGQVVRQLDAAGAVSVFGTLYDGIAVDARPRLAADRAVAVVEALAGADIGPLREPKLRVLPLAGGRFALVWVLKAAGESGIFEYFVDAHSGALVKRLDIPRQSAVGLGAGVHGEARKLSVRGAGSGFAAEDLLRPPPLRTYDLQGDLNLLLRFANGLVGLQASQLGQDADNNWGDPVVVDAHAYLGWTYDYYFKRFGRRGLDQADNRMLALVHVVRREDAIRQPAEVLLNFYLNAFYLGDGVAVFGEGLPSNLRFDGLRWETFAAGLDIVAHEMTHGVIEFTSDLVYENESGALNEAFCDMMGTSAEFFFQSPGSGLLRADYLIAEDIALPGGFRSLQNPPAFGDPDHYSIRFLGSGDNGGVHINSGIANHAFYLAIEGGRHRLSGVTVPGVGAANREQIEKVFYRAFTLMLPSSATFTTARAATVQSARDLYGAGGAVERAVAAAWTAVGVE